MIKRLKEILLNPIIIVAIIGLIGAIIGLIGNIYTVNSGKQTQQPEQKQYSRQFSNGAQSPNIIGDYNTVSHNGEHR